MNDAFWDRVWDTLDRIRELPKEQQADALDRECGDDPDVRAEVERLLRAHQDTGGMFGDGVVDSIRRAAPPVLPADLPNLTKQEIAGRYLVGAKIGEGGAGVVYEAADRPTGRTVAIKILPPSTPRRWRAARNEVAMLRLLRMPGVVHMQDDGRVEGPPGYQFVVMERLDGSPFPGAEVPVPWARLSKILRALLETLDRIHWIGIAHRDIKPGNVLVDEAGIPTVLDVGLSQDPRGELHFSSGVGTAAYMPPEQRRDGVVTKQSDLYAVGVMTFHALIGELPYAEDATTLDHAMERLNAQAPNLPETAREVVRGLIDPNPSSRFASTSEVLAVLNASGDAMSASRLQVLGVTGTAPLTPLALRSWFGGSARLTHIHEDAAEELHARSEGDPERALEELDAWQRARLGRWEHGKFFLTRPHLERLLGGLRVAPIRVDRERPSGPLDIEDVRLLLTAELAGRYATLTLLDQILDTDPSGTEERLQKLMQSGYASTDPSGRIRARRFPADASSMIEAESRAIHVRLARALPSGSYQRLCHWVASGARASIPAEAESVAQVMEAQSRFARGDAAVDEGLRAIDESSGTDLRDRLLLLALRLAMGSNSKRAVDHTLYRFETSAPTDRTRRYERIARAMQHCHAGQIERAVETLPKIDDAESELELRVIVGALLLFGRHVDKARHVEILDGIARIARERQLPSLHYALFAQRGWIKYRALQFDEAAAMHLAAADSAPHAIGRASAQMNAASAYLETGAFDLAEEHALLARDYCARMRMAAWESRAEWIVRSARYRRGDAIEADSEFARVAIEVSPPRVAALINLNEAAIARRRGDLPAQVTYAQATVDLMAPFEDPEMALPQALTLTNDSSEAKARECLAALRKSMPTWAAQGAGIVASVFPALQSNAARLIQSLEAELTDENKTMCLEITSIEDAMKSAGLLP